MGKWEWDEEQMRRGLEWLADTVVWIVFGVFALFFTAVVS